ncbi:DUF1003 domain-containing protein [Oscillatoria sp. FACHB-1406]|uniref:DUF1003 domain-containing protein n=1 Tax=Oscillatoria sp. FACHB-1406 TaxID=2692846 RepID=UPI001684FF0B|nr:DUF1003 domain-containing protein [Oscillatoria sp. FACHB-1406]MBD2578678.1 DUF1003 domain-containing protein [Oscillatoria sp. FACHB-1406]
MPKQSQTSTDERSTPKNRLFNLKPPRSRIVTTPLPDPIAKNIEAITALHNQELQTVSTHQQLLENWAVFFGRPVFLYSLLVVLILWIFCNAFGDFLPFTVPSFGWSEHGLDAASLIISTGVLVRQTRQENFAEQRAQLMLQLNLLSEQKIAKSIALLEELRADLPNVVNRYDPEATVMQQAADPIAVLEALQENLNQELSEIEEQESSRKEEEAERK